MVDPRNGPTESLVLPLALFGFLAPIVTFLFAIAPIASELKVAVLSVLVGAYTLFFVLAYRRFRSFGETSDARDAGTSSESMTETDRDDLASLRKTESSRLPDLTVFRLMLTRELAESSRNADSRPLSILAIEVPGLSEIYEKPNGGRLLARSEGLITGCLRGMDFAARTDVEEFFVLLPTAGEAGATEIARRIENSFLKEAISVDDEGQKRLRPFIGVSSYCNDGETTQSLIDAARAKVREAKAETAPDPVDEESEYMN